MASLLFPSPTQLKNISAPTDNTDAATKAYVDAQISGGASVGASGSNTQVQFNSANVLSASANFTFNSTTSILTVTGNIVSNNASITGTTSSTSKTTGALTIAGGLGVAGTAYNNRSVTQGAYGNIILNEYTGIYNQKDSGTSLIQTTTNALSAGIGIQVTGGAGNGSQLYSTGTLDIKIGVTTRAEDVPTGGTSVASVSSTGFTTTGLISTGNVTLSGANVSLGNISNLHITGGSADYVLKTDGAGNLSWTAQNTGTLTADVDAFTGDGSTASFSLANTPGGENFTLVAVQGILQPKTTYSVTGNVLTFDSAPPNTAIIEVTTFGGAVVSGGGGSGSPAMTWNISSSNATMSANNGYFVDTSGGPKTMTLPISATLGDTIRINDLAGTFSTNNLTVARNGHKIQGIADDLLIDANQSSFGLVYSNSTYGWKVLEL